MAEGMWISPDIKAGPGMRKLNDSNGLFDDGRGSALSGCSVSSQK